LRSTVRQAPQVKPVQQQQVERVEMLRASAAHQIVELRLAVRAKVNDLAVKHGVTYAQARGERLAERWKGFV